MDRHKLHVAQMVPACTATAVREASIEPMCLWLFSCIVTGIWLGLASVPAPTALIYRHGETNPLTSTPQHCQSCNSQSQVLARCCNASGNYNLLLNCSQQCAPQVKPGLPAALIMHMM